MSEGNDWAINEERKARKAMTSPAAAPETPLTDALRDRDFNLPTARHMGKLLKDVLNSHEAIETAIAALRDSLTKEVNARVEVEKERDKFASDSMIQLSGVIERAEKAEARVKELEVALKASGLGIQHQYEKRTEAETALAAAKADKLDAQRYRWLRDGNSDIQGIIREPGRDTELLADAELDAAIDSAIAGKGKGRADDCGELARAILKEKKDV